MSNMTSVKSALDAEIKHAKEGISFYSMRIATLEKMISQLDQLDGSHGQAPDASPTGKRAYTRKNKTRQEEATDGSAKANSAINASNANANNAGNSGNTRGSGKLPATTARFWQSLLSDTPISNKEIIKAAIAALKIKPNPTDLKKLKQRLANAITIMTKDGSMLSEGSGRERRFSIKKS